MTVSRTKARLTTQDPMLPHVLCARKGNSLGKLPKNDCTGAHRAGMDLGWLRRVWSITDQAIREAD
jgi:hypothetical protein